MAMRRGRRAAGGFLADFREFIMRGNVIDLAVAVIIGAAFNGIITSLIEDIITPVLLNPAMQAAGVDQLANLSANGIRYGVFLAAVINFLAISFVLFLIIRSFEAAKRRLASDEPEATPLDLAETNVQLAEAVNRLNDTMRSRG